YDPRMMTIVAAPVRHREVRHANFPIDRDLLLRLMRSNHCVEVRVEIPGSAHLSQRIPQFGRGQMDVRSDAHHVVAESNEFDVVRTVRLSVADRCAEVPEELTQKDLPDCHGTSSFMPPFLNGGGEDLRQVGHAGPSTRAQPNLLSRSAHPTAA